MGEYSNIGPNNSVVKKQNVVSAFLCQNILVNLLCIIVNVISHCFFV